MRHSSNLLLLLSSLSSAVFAGEMGAVSTHAGDNYLVIGGGYYSSNDQANYTRISSGVINTQQSFNDTNHSGYGQIGLGRQDHLDRLMFDHQVVLSKLGNRVGFTTTDSNWTWYQNVDFGYDWMPKMSVLNMLEAHGILGVHYARFTYQKVPFDPANTTTTAFDVYADQIGFNLGAGLNYAINERFTVGVNYQHWQYSAFQASGTNSSVTLIETQKYTPTFNLFGAELRYYF